MNEPMRTKEVKRIFGSIESAEDHTNSIRCKHCSARVWFMGNDTPERFNCPKCGMGNADNLVDEIINYESGFMEEEEIVAFFQRLINSGMAWTLQGRYGRTAAALIEAGMCSQ